MSSRLNEQDQERVKQYLSAPQHQVERQAFKPWRLLLVIVTAVIGLGLLSRLLSHLVH
jgi:CHASE3 domain sensor protein